MRQVKQEFHSSGFMCDVDLDPGCTLNKKIRNAQLAQYNFILGQQQQHALPSLPSVIPVLILFSLSVYILIFLSLSLLCLCLESGGREGEDEQHGERTHPGQQSPRRAHCGGVRRAPETAQNLQVPER